jgi:DNA-binding LytR/AlgR family response regulator
MNQMMNPLAILIVEDDTLTAMDLRQTLERTGHIVTATVRSLQAAVKAAKTIPPDLALIDVELDPTSTGNGIETARTLLTHQAMPIIFLTAHAELEAFQSASKVVPAAYLIKPFRADELVLHVALAHQNFQVNRLNRDTTLLNKHLFLPVGNSLQRIELEDVRYAEADGAYTNIFTDQDKKHQVSTNLGSLVHYFPLPHFFRLSRSLLVNLHHLERLDRYYLFLVSSKTPIPIPSTRRNALLKQLTVVRTKPGGTT